MFDHNDTGIFIADDKPNYFKAIVDVINDISRTKCGARKTHRAVIVFFESSERMEEFRTSEYFRQVVDNTSVNRLSESTAPDHRDYIIKKAATAGQVTLATKVFGRGTDFISRDNQLNDRGGTHIVQTFLSEALSEELQIMGRTARQGQKGSYSLLLLLEDTLVKGPDKTMAPRTDTLAHFGIDRAAISVKSRSERYTFLDGVRKEKREKQSVQIEDDVAVATSRDAATHCYFNALLRSDKPQAMALFKDIYTALKGGHHVGLHVVFMLDESGSMQGPPYAELRSAYSLFVSQRLQKGAENDVMSVITFNNNAVRIATRVPFADAPALPYRDGGTSFHPPLELAEAILNEPAERAHTPILILMTDGGCADLEQALDKLRSIDSTYKDDYLQVHLVGFGPGADAHSLSALRSVCTDGYIHNAGIGELSSTFTRIENSLIIPEYK